MKNVVKAANIFIGDYTYYDDSAAPTEFEKNNILFNYPQFWEKLVIGKFCQIASGTKFIMGSANHRLCSVTTYPFNVFGGAFSENTLDHISQLPHKGDTVIGNDVWLGRKSVEKLSNVPLDIKIFWYCISILNYNMHELL
mgnify:FL=1